jgi:oligo-1,6-glucosidase
VLHLHRGTPYVYQGEELGMTNAHFRDLSDYRDIESLRFAAEARAHGRLTDVQLTDALGSGSRDNARTPVQWDATAWAGFTTGEPWIGVNPNHVTVNAEAERADAASVFHHYRRLIALRHDDPVVRLGDFALVAAEHPYVYAFTRSGGGPTLFVAGNFTGDPQQVEVAGVEPASAELVIGNYGDAPDVAGDVLRLRPWEVVVLRAAPQRP